MNEQQIIEAALKDGNMPLAQAAAYRLLLRCAEQLSAMENLEKEEASGGRSAATPSPDQQIAALTQERDEARRTRDAAQAECNRLLGVKRRLEEELEATQSCCKEMRGKLDAAAMVRAFNRKFGVPIAPTPAFPERDRIDLRVRLIAEELCEFLKACGYEHEVDIHRQGQKACVFYASCSPSVVPDMIAAADGLADLQYVIEGTALEFGIPLAAVFAEVHRSNMTKTGQPDAIWLPYSPVQIERIVAWARGIGGPERYTQFAAQCEDCGATPEPRYTAGLVPLMLAIAIWRRWLGKTTLP